MWLARIKTTLFLRQGNNTIFICNISVLYPFTNFAIYYKSP